jgi:mono/diheme cytochrome c family protein
MKRSLYILGLMALILSACGEEEPETPINEVDCTTTTNTYAAVKSIIDANCIGCHSYGGSAVAHGDFSSYSGLQNYLNSSSSTFVAAISATDDSRMPPAAAMSSADIEQLNCWIEAGFPE